MNKFINTCKCSYVEYDFEQKDFVMKDKITYNPDGTKIYKLQKHDRFTIKWMDEKYLLGMPIIILRVWKERKWNKPHTWFRNCYEIEFVGDVKMEN